MTSAFSNAFLPLALLPYTLLLHPETLRMVYFRPSLPTPPDPVICLGLLTLVLMVQCEYVILRDPFPALAVYTVKVDLATAVGITEGGLVDGVAAKVAGLLDGQVGAVATIEDSVCVHRTGAHGEHITTHTVPF